MKKTVVLTLLAACAVLAGFASNQPSTTSTRTEVCKATSEQEIAARREAQEARGDKAWTPKDRQREVSFALRAYATLATSADKGAVRDKSKLGG